MHMNSKFFSAGSLLLIFILLQGFPLLLSGCKDDSSNRLKIGDTAPDFDIVDLQGTRMSSDQWRGSPVILRFWDTECKYCRADSPIINI